MSSTDEASGGEAGTRGRVLVVDDEPLMLSTLRVTLEDDYEVVALASGRAARELLAEDVDFDAVLCDLMMPGESGMDLHAWLVDQGSDLATRMVFMSGGAYTERSRQFLDRVPNPRVGKPFDIDELLLLLAQMKRP